MLATFDVYVVLNPMLVTTQIGWPLRLVPEPENPRCLQYLARFAVRTIFRLGFGGGGGLRACGGGGVYTRAGGLGMYWGAGGGGV
jgi:hypothetical protein